MSRFSQGDSLVGGLLTLEALLRQGLPVFGVCVGVHLVALRLARLRQEDQWRRVRGLRRERQVEQDERVLVEVDEDLESVEHDLRHHHDGLRDDVPGRTEETSDRLSSPSERICAERRGEVLVLPVESEVILAHGV
jgi:hypothetical protein